MQPNPSLGAVDLACTPPGSGILQRARIGRWYGDKSRGEAGAYSARPATMQTTHQFGLHRSKTCLLAAFVKPSYRRSVDRYGVGEALAMMVAIPCRRFR